jgi:heptosyltransferase II
MNQIVIQTAFIGDVLLSIPMLRAIKSEAPTGTLHLVCREGMGSFFLQIGLVDVVHEIKKGDGASYKGIAAKLKNIEFENLYCVHESFRSAFLASRIKAKKKFGFAKWWNRAFFDIRKPREMQLPDALRQLSLVQDPPSSWERDFQNSDEQSTINFHGRSIPQNMSMELQANPADRDEVIQRCGLPQDYVVVAPGSIWATKRWPFFAELVEDLTSRGQFVVLAGGKDDQALCESLQQKIVKRESVLNLAGKTSLYESFLILTKANHLYCNDSGIMHLGAAADVKITAIFGPTTLALGYRPWTQKSSVVQVATSCRPCGSHGHHICPIGTHACMRAVSSRMVTEASKI